MVARSLGTINHTLLTLEALRRRYASGGRRDDGRARESPTIEMPSNGMGTCAVLGEMPLFDPLTAESARARGLRHTLDPQRLLAVAP